MKLLIFPLLVLLTSCTSTNVDFDWEPLETGCQNKALFWPALTEYSEISLSSVRFGYQPDTGRGPAFLVTIDSGANHMEQTDESFFLAAYGDYEKSCAIKMPLDECPEAGVLLEELAKVQLPLVYAFDNPEGILLMHGTNYYLSSNDGLGNFNTWSFYGYGHPMIEIIEQSKQKIEHCTSKALSMYEGL